VLDHRNHFRVGGAGSVSGVKGEMRDVRYKRVQAKEERLDNFF
jgi:hypothetical protein